MGQFAGCIEGMAAACDALEFPVVSGNVSLYNETRWRSDPPTPAVGGLGLIRNIDHSATTAFKNEGSAIFLVGATKGHLGQSLFLREIANVEAGNAPSVDLVIEKTNGDFVRAQIESQQVLACHDVSDGGLMIALSEMALGGNIGATISTDTIGEQFWDVLFGEDQARYLLEVANADTQALLSAANQAGIAIHRIGLTGGNHLVIDDLSPISIETLRFASENWLPDLMAS